MTFLADITFSTEAIAVIGVLLGGLCSAVVVVFKLLMRAKDHQLLDLIAQRKSYKEIAADSVRALEQVANRIRGEQGMPPLTIIAPVVPEHSSPVSEMQKEVAELQTLRARCVAATLSINESNQPQKPQ